MNPDYMDDVQLDDNERLRATANNAAIILFCDPEWRGKIGLDEQTSLPIWRDEMPAVNSLPGADVGDLLQSWHEITINQWFVEKYGISFDTGVLLYVIKAVASMNVACNL